MIIEAVLVNVNDGAIQQICTRRKMCVVSVHAGIWDKMGKKLQKAEVKFFLGGRSPHSRIGKTYPSSPLFDAHASSLIYQSGVHVHTWHKTLNTANAILFSNLITLGFIVLSYHMRVKSAHCFPVHLRGSGLA